LDAPANAAPALIVYGGKITTYRRLAEEALGKLAHLLPMGRPWTAAVPLPGGDIAWDGIAAFASQCRARWPFLAEAHALRLARAYGSRVDEVLGSDADSGMPAVPGGTITLSEVRYLIRKEWAQTPEDILW